MVVVVCVCVSVANSSFSCKKPRKEKYHKCKNFTRFSIRVSSHKKGSVRFSHEFVPVNGNLVVMLSSVFFGNIYLN